MWGRINMKVRGREGGDKDLQRVDKGKEEGKTIMMRKLRRLQAKEKKNRMDVKKEESRKKEEKT